jgi:AcrR family transcriptional regulator
MDAPAPKKTDTKTRILDAAEALFALNGYKRTSIKALALRAKVNQAAVNYHFGSKIALVEKVIARRLSLINELRMQKFQALEDAAWGRGRPAEVKELLRAFIEPVFTATDTMQKGTSFLMIEGRAFAEPDDTIRELFIRHFQPSFMRLSELMEEALPGLSAGTLRWRLHFVIGAMAHALRVCGCQRPMPDIFPPPHQIEQVVNALVCFLASGMNAPDSFQNGQRGP